MNHDNNSTRAKSMDNDIFIEFTEPIKEENQRINYDNFILSLKSIGKNIAKQEKLHVKKAKKNDLLRKFISYPSVLFSGIATFSGFAQFNESDNNPECGIELWNKIIIVVFGLLTLIFVGTREFFHFDTKYVQHTEAIKNLRAFFSVVDTYKSINKGYEGDRLKIINSLNKQYFNILESLPDVDGSEELQFSVATPHTSIQNASPKPPPQPKPESPNFSVEEENPHLHVYDSLTELELQQMCSGRRMTLPTEKIKYEMERLRDA